ncbi:hypothetical protein ACRASX_09865 [Flavobacterium sp. TMP13]|uniref:hypothetical protein n=1 Tax=unclassified Flavobacterium TaxID=196869 RepID=UPI00076D2508|nr:hypothetical protein [Flavobacterium sp. TAB 87]KVV15684.1 hypothetical protein AP058_00716 [Flavobacterium sp. TAB 87]
MTKNIYILLILTFGLILGPTQSFAHKSKVVMDCCQKESTDSGKSCCSEKQSKETNHNCDSSCSGASCACPVVYSGFTMVFNFQEENKSLFDFPETTANYYYTEIGASSDFHSIWLPPKLS